MTLGKIGSTNMMRHGLTARDYVQDGLIAMWDGIENAGWCAHDPKYIGCTNLCGHGCDLNVVNNGTISDNCILSTSTTAACLIQSTDKSDKLVTTYINVAKAYTLEIVGSGFAKNVNTVDMSLTVGVTGSKFTIYRDTAYGKGSIYVPSGYLMKPGGWITNGSFGEGRGSHTRCADESRYRNYINGVQKQSSSSVGADFRYTTSTYAKLGAVAFSTCDKFYCARLYNRMLTGDEVYANNIIDKARFNLP